MRKTILPIFLFLNSWCANAQGQIVNDSILIEHHYRTFHFALPGPAKGSASLIFILHGSGSFGMEVRKSVVRLEQRAKVENILLVYPDGYKNFWNECRKAADSPANLENINEMGFFDYMIVYFEKKYRVNPHQIFAIGTSGGGHMVYKLALTMTEKFKAVTAIIANLPTPDNLDCAESKIPISIMIINGTSDPINPYEGGLIKFTGHTMGTVRSTEATFKYWADLDGYEGEPVHEFLPDTDPADGKTIESFGYTDKEKPDVVLLKVNGGKHDYPNDIDVYLKSWEFFKRQMKK